MRKSFIFLGEVIRDSCENHFHFLVWVKYRRLRKKASLQEVMVPEETWYKKCLKRIMDNVLVYSLLIPGSGLIGLWGLGRKFKK
jgi:hypothetical protein